MKTLLNPTLAFAPASNGDRDRKSNRAVQTYAIGTDLAQIFLRTVKAKADYIALALRDVGVDEVSQPIPAVAFDASEYWSINIVSSDVDSAPVFSLYSEKHHDAATLAALLSLAFPRFAVEVCKYQHTRYIFSNGTLIANQPELSLDMCRTQFGMYRLPKDWL